MTSKIPRILGLILFRAFLKNGMGPATKDFGRGRGGETEAPLQPAVTVEPTKASPKRPIANAAVDFTGFAGRWLIVQVSLGGDTNRREVMED